MIVWLNVTDMQCHPVDFNPVPFPSPQPVTEADFKYAKLFVPQNKT